MKEKIKVTVWNEYTQEQMEGETAKIYPQGLHVTIADFLNMDDEIQAATSVITDDEQGLSNGLLENTDVLIWWGHMRHGEINDIFAERVAEKVRRGMGMIFLHSSHQSKPFIRLLGTTGRLGWREAREKSRVWTINPAHPITKGVPEQFLLDHEEMYSEPFGIPEPLSTVFISWFEGGNVFRSGVTFIRDLGKIFYFQPGHETFPIYHNANIQRIITNAVKWARPLLRLDSLDCPEVKESLEPIGG
jgi:trehalose utilization protein